MMKLNDFQRYEATLRIPYEKYFELIYETKYLIEARLSPERCFIATKSFYGCNRRMAVEKATTWYSKYLKDVLGAPHKTMRLNDPMGEIVYEEGFVCTELCNKYLDEETIERLLDEAEGDLGVDESKGDGTLAPCSVKRLKRRRKQETILNDRLIQSTGGTIYYKMKELIEGKSGRLKVRKVKLASKSLEKAEREIIRRGLNKFEKFTSGKVNSEHCRNLTPKAA